jgi:hypothetical protein
MHIVVIFLDGIGLGDNNPAINPFAVIHAPTLHRLSNGQRWLRDTPRTESERAIFLPTDARLGVPGRPQSATGQATILTGRNVAAEIGEHYGPKPSPPIREILNQTNLFKTLVEHGRTAALINPFPPRFFAGINSGKRLPTSIHQAVLAAGLPILTEKEYYRGEAVSPDWTGEGWSRYLGYPDAPTYSPEEAGALLGRLAIQRDLTFFSTWITDEIGHRGPFEDGVAFMERFDRVMAGLLETWDDEQGLIIITSDHGNLEVQGDRRHSENPVPTVVIGAARRHFAEEFSSLIDITPSVLRAMGIENEA